MKKRIFAMIMAVCLILSILPAASFAADGTEVVAKMSLFSYTAHAFDTGHAWLSFENLTDETIVVGVYQLAPGEIVTVGTFKNTRSDGAGIYYNVEAYCTARYGSNGRVSLSQDITAAQLNTVNSRINSNNIWTLVRNCSWFAEKVWNSVAEIRVFSGSTPSCLKTSMKVESCYHYQTNQSMNNPAADQVYKQMGNALVVVSSGSLKNPL